MNEFTVAFFGLELCNFVIKFVIRNSYDSELRD
jgi:hypothetical protein